MLFFRFDAKARTVVIGLEPRPAEPIFPKKAVRQSSTDFESSLCLSNREAKNRDRALKCSLLIGSFATELDAQHQSAIPRREYPPAGLVGGG